VLVRPTDRLRFVVAPQANVVIELLIESIGGVNELGSRLTAWSSAGGRGQGASARCGSPIPVALAAWQGLLHVIHDSPNADVITLPTALAGAAGRGVHLLPHRGRGADARRAAGDTIVVGAVNQQVNRAVIVYNNGEEWALVGT
jgi:hypothetical protein